MSLKNKKTLILVWQPEVDRGTRERPVPIGRLEFDGAEYRFEYLNGVTAAQGHGFAGLVEFPVLSAVYTSEKLFPVFANRLMSHKRKDFPEYVARLGLESAANSPEFELELLARSAGRKATDGFRVFPIPERTPSGFVLRFFLEQSPPEANAVYSTVDSVDHVSPVGLTDDKTATPGIKTANGDLLGLIPSYYETELRWFVQNGYPLHWQILKINTPPARWAPNVVLIEVTGPWPTDWTPFETNEFALFSSAEFPARLLLQPSRK